MLNTIKIVVLDVDEIDGVVCGDDGVKQIILFLQQDQGHKFVDNSGRNIASIVSGDENLRRGMSKSRLPSP